MVDLADGPDQQDAGEDARDEVVRPVPALDARPVHAQYRLPDRQRAVVPDQHEHEHQVQDPAAQQRIDDTRKSYQLIVKLQFSEVTLFA